MENVSSISQSAASKLYIEEVEKEGEDEVDGSYHVKYIVDEKINVTFKTTFFLNLFTAKYMTYTIKLSNSYLDSI